MMQTYYYFEEVFSLITGSDATRIMTGKSPNTAIPLKQNRIKKILTYSVENLTNYYHLMLSSALLLQLQLWVYSFKTYARHFWKNEDFIKSRQLLSVNREDIESLKYAQKK